MGAAKRASSYVVTMREHSHDEEVVPRITPTIYFNSIALTELFVLQYNVKWHVLEVIREIDAANGGHTTQRASTRRCEIGLIKGPGDAQ